MAAFIKTSTTGVVMTFGKFTRTMNAGLNFYVPFIQQIHPVSNRTLQKEFKFRVLTKDKVFANMSLSLQYKIKPEDTATAFFSLDKPIEQMGAYIENSLRSHAPKTSLATLFESFDEIGQVINSDLTERMKNHGFTIENILMTGIDPDPEVTAAINSISASERLKEAAKNKAEQEYIKKIKDAEGDSQRKILQGEGIAGQRRAILNGYKENIAEMIKLTGSTPQEIMTFLLKCQELDMKEQIGRSENTKVLFMESGATPQNQSQSSVPLTTNNIITALETQTPAQSVKGGTKQKSKQSAE